MDKRFKWYATALKAATREHYLRLSQKHSDLYGYSLYTEDGVSSIFGVASYESSISVPPSDKTYNYYRFGPHEWKEWEDFGLFDAANSMLKTLYEQVPFETYRAGGLAAAFKVLTELESEGLFGPRTDSRFVVLWLADSSEELMGTSAKALNSPTVYRLYAAEYA